MFFPGFSFVLIHEVSCDLVSASSSLWAVMMKVIHEHRCHCLSCCSAPISNNLEVESCFSKYVLLYRGFFLQLRLVHDNVSQKTNNHFCCTSVLHLDVSVLKQLNTQMGNIRPGGQMRPWEVPCALIFLHFTTTSMTTTITISSIATAIIKFTTIIHVHTTVSKYTVTTTNCTFHI